MTFLELDKVSKIYTQNGMQVPALNDISFKLGRGDSLAICGSSGAGKSTLLNIIGGLDEPTSGVVRVDGKRIDGLNEKERSRFRREKLGFIFQFHHLLGDFNVLENVMMPLLIRGVDRKSAREAALWLLNKVGLDGKENRGSREISGGEQQRVAIARALVHRPQLVLADEPTGNLDDVNGAKVFELLCSLNHDLEATLIVVTHNVNFAKNLNHSLWLKSGAVTSFT